MTHVQPIDPQDAKALIEELDSYLAELYPAESNHIESIESLRTDNVHMLGAYDAAEILAIGAVKLERDYAEIKRVYVFPLHRGKGLATSIMSDLEQVAIEYGLGD